MKPYRKILTEIEQRAQKARIRKLCAGDPIEKRTAEKRQEGLEGLLSILYGWDNTEQREQR